MSSFTPSQLAAELSSGRIIPYLGPEVLALAPEAELPSTPAALVELITAKVTVPHKIRNNLTAASQYVENFKHRKTLVAQLQEAFKPEPKPTVLHDFLATIDGLPLIVDVWYDSTMAKALEGRSDFGEVQGVSRAEYFGDWVHYFYANHERAEESDAAGWKTLLYKPLGSIAPASNFIISDSDYVEVLTEIDIQTPIPEKVQAIRSGRQFLFLGCRFSNQLERSYARQIMKRSSDRHFAVLPGELTRNEKRFLGEQNIERIDMPLADFVAEFTASSVETLAVANA